MTTLKKFRFDSFASEFASNDDDDVKPTTGLSTKLDETADNDSGIDSEETQVSPPLIRILQGLPRSDNRDDVQPLSLVLRKDQDKARAPAVKRHWKKFLKDQASIATTTTNERMSPAKKFKYFPAQTDLQEEAENLCLSDLSRTTESTVAQALLSLGRSPVRQSLPLQPLPLHSLQQQQQLQPQQHHTLQQKFPFANVFCKIRLPQHPEPAPFQYSNFLASRQHDHHQHQHQLQITPSLTIKEFQLQSDPHHEANRCPSAFSTSTPFENAGNSFRLSRLLLPTIPENQPMMMKQPESIVSKKPFFCSECKKGFSTQSGHIKHQELHRANQIQKTFSCKFCNKGYTSLSALKMHTRTHTLPCKCQICGKSFSRPWLLQGHVRTHTGEKPFSCGFCSRSFADKSNLRAHLQTHLQTKKYSCQHCQKTFSRMSLLSKHTETGCQIKIKTESGFSSGLLRA